MRTRSTCGNLLSPGELGTWLVTFGRRLGLVAPIGRGCTMAAWKNGPGACLVYGVPEVVQALRAAFGGRSGERVLVFAVSSVYVLYY